MKVILSRKGFDSLYGGYPSPILPDSTLISLPIPSSGDDIKYSELRLDKLNSYFDLMRQLKPNIKSPKGMIKLTRNTECHLDPDIFHNVLQRDKDWSPLFGQINQAQTHLENQGINEGDLFLFFGWFRQTLIKNKKLSFDKSAPNLHIIFGYLQIGRIYQVNEKVRLSNWMKYHPHVLNQERKKNQTNTIYVANKKLTWDNKILGSGIFNCSQELILTKKGYSRSRWSLPEFFRKVNISYHSKNSWKAEGYFQSVGRGQEFVIEDNDKVENWAKSLIKKNRRL